MPPRTIQQDEDKTQAWEQVDGRWPQESTPKRASGLLPSQDLASNNAQEAGWLCEPRTVGADPGTQVQGELPQHLPRSSTEKSHYVTGLQDPTPLGTGALLLSVQAWGLSPRGL